MRRLACVIACLFSLCLPTLALADGYIVRNEGWYGNIFSMGKGANVNTLTMSGTNITVSGDLTVTGALSGGSAAWSTAITLPATGTDITGTAAEDLRLIRTATDATAENGMAIQFTALDTTSGTTAQYVLFLDNDASTEAADGVLVIDNSDADDTVTNAILINNSGAGTGFTNILNTATLDITYAGAITGATGVSTSGALASTGTFDVDGGANLSDTTAGANVAIGNSTGNITMLSDNWDVGCTDATDDVFQVLNATGSVLYIDLDLGAADGLTLGNVAGVLALNSSDWTIDATGVAAGLGNITSDGTVDANAFTSDAGAGLDTQAAGALEIGAATATSVNIADTGVVTDVQGGLTVEGSIDTAGAGALDLGAATATEVNIADAGVLTDVEGTLSVDEAATFDVSVSTPVITSTGTTINWTNGSTGAVNLDFRDYADSTDDDMAHVQLQTNLTDTGSATEDADFVLSQAIGGALTVAMTFDADGDITTGVGRNFTADGVVDADSLTTDAGAGLDAQAAGALEIGAATATSVNIADTGVVTDIQGGLTVEGSIDTAGAGALDIGPATATSVNIADAGVTTDIQGPVTVLGGIDTAGAAALDLGAANATAVNLGATDIDVTATGTGGGSGTADFNVDGYMEVDGTAEFNGTVQCDGTVVIGDDLDWDANAANEVVTIDSTDVATTVGLVTITDARAGVNNDNVAEASLRVAASGTYAIHVPSGDVVLAGGLDVAGTFNPPDTFCLTPFSNFLDPTEASATTDYASLNAAAALAAGIADNSSTTEGNINQWIAPVAGVFSNLRVTVDVAPGAGQDPWIITLREAGGDESLTCTIDETATSCTATGPSGAIAAGAIVNYSISSAGGDADPTAAALMTISACWGQ